MTNSRNGYNGKSSKKKLVLISEEKLPLLYKIDPNLTVIPIPFGVNNPERFFSKPALREIHRKIGDIDGFAHYGGNTLLVEFKPSTWLSEYDKSQICSQLCLALETGATYWIVEWKNTRDGYFEVSELIEVAPDGTLSIIEVNVEGLAKMCTDWWNYATDKNNFKRSCKWLQAETIFYKLQKRTGIQELDKRINKDDDDTDGEIAAI
ncbi:hypothetical protein [Bacillus cereus group sp. BcHK140]|uniref:hypothetical protein n=1 Tax=Bacillus cereus group sp. BcHK140 TaxID=3018092 RepID=UPI0022E3C9DC|nr:hypothetical protein [Bacillus cereus group sp. BcHK140]MDA1918256.1 hypothetical protein [Bacillus cereus group sp. BcHK140]